MVALFVILTIIVFLTADYFVQRAELGKVGALAARSPATPAAMPAAAAPGPTLAPIDQVPPGLFFALGHTWSHLEPSGALRVGVDRLAPTLLGLPVQVELVPRGTHVHAGDTLARLHGKTRSVAVRSPVDGFIGEVNQAVVADPLRTLADPFETGWLYRLTPNRLAPAVKTMRVGEEARAWMRQELVRLRDLVSGLVASGRFAGATLPDGGLPIEGLAERLDPEAWAEVVDACFGGEMDATTGIP
jgi:glycine cleavage system H protein